MKQDLLPVPIDSSLFNDEQRQGIAGLAPQLFDAFEKVQMWRTDTEARVAVLNHLMYPTPASRYWQCVREQTHMLENTVDESLGNRLNEIQISELQEKIADAYGHDQSRLDIELKRCLWTRAKQERATRDRCRELAMWEMLKQEALAEDPEMNTQDPNEHQLVSYTVRFILRSAHPHDTMNSGERDNLVGQLVTALRLCEERGVMGQVRRWVPKNAIEELNVFVRRITVMDAIEEPSAKLAHLHLNRQQRRSQRK